MGRYNTRSGKPATDALFLWISSMIRTFPLTSVIVFSTSLLVSAGPVVLETDSLRLTIAENGNVRSLLSKQDSTEYVRAATPTPLAVVYRGGRSVPAFQGKYAASTKPWIYQGGQAFAASNVTRERDRLRVDFGEANVTATYQVTSKSDYLAFELLHLTGEPIDRIDLLSLKLVDLPQRGAWVNFASNRHFGVCLCAANVRTNAEMDQQDDCVTMRAVAEREVGLQGTTAVLFGCPQPRTQFLDTMAIVERDFHLPPGANNRRSPGTRYSYLWASHPTTENINQYIRWAKRAGFRMILFSYTSFATGAGHFEWNDAYPNGMADLKHVTDSIRDAGLKVGLHIHYSKTRKNDSYVTPVPDARLHQIRHFTLAEAVDEQAETIPVTEDPTGCTLDQGRKILKMGHELIAYESYRTQPDFAFTSCERGHLGSTASSCTRGTRLGLLNVDTWPIFIRFDQNTDIQDDVAQRIGEIYRQTGPYEMVYFDGAEDVHAPFWHHVASAQQRVFRCLDPVPPVCEAAHYSHFSWHMITRSNAYDIVAPADGMKDFCRLMPCPTAAERSKDFSRIDFGWLGRFGQKTAGPDVWEYVASRAAAWDCPISLKASPADFASNPRWEDCLDAIRIWEDARLGNHLTQNQPNMLRNVQPEDAHYVPCFDQRGIWENIAAGENLTPTQKRILNNRQEHHLFLNEQNEYELVPVDEVTGCNPTIKAYSFQRSSHPDQTYVLIWAVDQDVNLRLLVDADSVRLMRPFGTELPVAHSENETVATIGPRSYLVFTTFDIEQVRQVLSSQPHSGHHAPP
jgi:hypothetical protein